MRNVIICEDDPWQVIDLVDAIEESGHSVVGTFSNGADAIRAARLLRPDIAVVDLNLADGSTGGNIALELAELGCAIVVVSGSAVVPRELQSVQHVFIGKPVPQSVVGAVIGSLPVRPRGHEEVKVERLPEHLAVASG